jgi:Xaa-Pro dipeptidase
MNKSRIQRVIKNMDAMGLSCILVSAPHSVYYLTGRFINPGERMLALMINTSGDVRLFANRLFAQAPSADLPITEFDDTDDSVAVLAEYLPSGRLGIDKFWPSHFTIRLMQARPDITPVLGSAPVDDARMLKDAEELSLMREASRLNDEALRRLIPTLTMGETELDVCGRYVQIAKELGAEGASFEPLVCFGAGCAEPHHASDDTPLGANQTVILDLGLAKNRMMSDMTRTVVMGKADDEMKRVYDLVKAANAAGRAAARPGVPMSEIDRAARKVIEDAGYGRYFIHRTGHGIGLEVHEPTDVSSSNHIISQPHMVFSIEPGVYLPGRFGVRIEDLVALTEDGCETLNSLERELIEL